MKNYRVNFKTYLSDLAAKKPTPGGGSAVCLSFCLGVSLLEMAMNYSSEKDEKIKPTLTQLKKIKAKIYSYIDLDSKVFDKIMKTPKNKRAPFIKQSESIMIGTGTSCSSVYTLVKKIEPNIKNCIISDFEIGLDLLKVALRGCLLNLEANNKMFDRKSKYIITFKKSLREWK